MLLRNYYGVPCVPKINRLADEAAPEVPANLYWEGVWGDGKKGETTDVVQALRVRAKINLHLWASSRPSDKA
jgi:hypothetical protein